jgi:hypothetical protein
VAERDPDHGRQQQQPEPGAGKPGGRRAVLGAEDEQVRCANSRCGVRLRSGPRREATNRIQHNAASPSHLQLAVVDPAATAGCRPAAAVTGLRLERLAGSQVRLSWTAAADPCHRRYRVYAGVAGPQWPWIVRRPVAETTATELVTLDPGVFWQVLSEGTDSGNGPR